MHQLCISTWVYIPTHHVGCKLTTFMDVVQNWNHCHGHILNRWRNTWSFINACWGAPSHEAKKSYWEVASLLQWINSWSRKHCFSTWAASHQSAALVSQTCWYYAWVWASQTSRSGEVSLLRSVGGCQTNVLCEFPLHPRMTLTILPFTEKFQEVDEHYFLHKPHALSWVDNLPILIRRLSALNTWGSLTISSGWHFTEKGISTFTALAFDKLNIMTVVSPSENSKQGPHHQAGYAENTKQTSRIIFDQIIEVSIIYRANDDPLQERQWDIQDM